MLGQELAVEQLEPANLEPRDEIGQRNLGRIARPAEHALPKESPSEAHAIQAADQFVARPGLDRMGIAAPVQLGIGTLDIRVDPGIGPPRGRLRAMRDDLAECRVHGDPIAIRADRLGERVREVEAIEWEHAALLGFDPEDVVRVACARHREYPDRVSAQQQVRI